MEGRGGASQPLFVLQMFIRGKEKSIADFSFKFSAAVFQQVHDSLTAFLSALSCFAFLRLSSRSRLFLQPSSMCSLPAHPHLWLYARQPLTCSVKKQAQRREANRPPHSVCNERWKLSHAATSGKVLLERAPADGPLVSGIHSQVLGSGWQSRVWRPQKEAPASPP